MARTISTRTNSLSLRSWSSLIALLALPAGVAACGGSVRIADTQPISIVGRPPRPAAEPEPPRVELRDDRIVINEKIQFAYDSDRILTQSFSLLDEVAALIKANPQIKKIEIGGHASTEGSDDHNLQLSDRRANAVMRHLIEQSLIAGERLTSKGYGELKPLVQPDDTEQRREVNRRVEFLILEQSPRVASEETPASTPEPAPSTMTESARTSGSEP